MTDIEVAARAADAAAAVLLALRSGDLSGRALGDAGDAAAQRAILEVLRAERPDDVVFSEEATDDRRRLAADRVWIVDPLDGTREYGEDGRHDWAVHVALWSAGELAEAAVALPGLGEVLVTDPAPALPPRADGPVRIAVSRTRPCGARSTCTCTGAGCTSGTPRHRSPSPGRPASRRAGWTAHRWSTTSPTPRCPTWSSAARSWPSGSWLLCGPRDSGHWSGIRTSTTGFVDAVRLS